MRFKILIISILLINSVLYSQKVIADKFEIEILKAKEPSAFSTQILRGIKFDETQYKYIMVKCQVKSIGETHALISAFSLLDTINKVRYRLGDYLGYAAIIGNPERNYFRKTKSVNKNYSINLPQYDDTEVDQFDKFTFEGYTNSEIQVEFGTKKNPDPSIVYFGQTAYKNFKAELFFIIPINLNVSDFDLYYQKSKVGIAKIK